MITSPEMGKRLWNICHTCLEWDRVKRPVIEDFLTSLSDVKRMEGQSCLFVELDDVYFNSSTSSIEPAFSDEINNVDRTFELARFLDECGVPGPQFCSYEEERPLRARFTKEHAKSFYLDMTDLITYTRRMLSGERSDVYIGINSIDQRRFAIKYERTPKQMHKVSVLFCFQYSSFQS